MGISFVWYTRFYYICSKVIKEFLTLLSNYLIMKNIIINNGKTTVTISACHNVTVSEKSITIDLITTSTKTYVPKSTKTAGKRRGRPLGSKNRKKTSMKK
jgi:hypothetical protein